MRRCAKRYALDLRVLTQQSVQRNAAGNAFLRMQQVGVDTQAGFNAGQRSILRRFRVKVTQKADCISGVSVTDTGSSVR